jgi:hypothetical protein
MINRNLCKTILSNNGNIIPLLLPPDESKGLGIMNPSILIDKDKILVNLRNINYTLYHSENNQLFNNRFGPLSYLNPENDMHLRTYNFLCELDTETLEIKRHNLIDTSKFDIEPVWEFVGLEDIRLVSWDDKLYGCGVRRDVKPNGEGRMELSELEITDTAVNEISRSRIQPPNNPNSYCEKNWMPVLDMPYHFVKWSNPIEVVKVNPARKTSSTVFLGPSYVPNVPDFRGGSQVITYKDYRMCIVHEVNLFNNKLSQKDATYMHRFLIWDKNWTLMKISEPFSFMNGEIEFSCGLAVYKKDLLITFGFQDNSAYLLKVPEAIINNITGFNFKI